MREINVFFVCSSWFESVDLLVDFGNNLKNEFCCKWMKKKKSHHWSAVTAEDVFLAITAAAPSLHQNI